MVDGISLAAADPALKKALPEEPEELFRLGRVAVRIYGMICRDLDDQVKDWIAAAGNAVKRKDRKETTRTLREELPVFGLIHVLDRLNQQDFFAESGVAELLRGFLVPCFALDYRSLYDEANDPMKQILARLDWYLDGDKTDLMAAFDHFSATLIKEGLKEAAPLRNHLEEVMLPLMDKRIDLAFRYEFM